MSLKPSLLLLTDRCIHYERLSETNSTTGGKLIKLSFYNQNLYQILCLLVRLSVCLSMFSEVSSAVLTPLFVVYQPFSLHYVSRLDIHK